MRLLLLFLLLPLALRSQDVVVVGQALTAGPSYLVEENFEGTGTPTGFSSSGTPDYDSTVTVLEGAQSLAVDGADIATYTFGAAQSTLNTFVILRHGGTPGANTSLFILRDGSAVAQVTIQHRTTNVFRILNSTGAQVGADFSVGTTAETYYAWIEYVAGSGADAVIRAYFSTNTTKGSADVSVSNAPNTSSIANIRFVPASGGGVFDDFKASTGTIGDNP